MPEEDLVPDANDPEAPDPADAESDLDGCDVPIEAITHDEDLPATEGGVA